MTPKPHVRIIYCVRGIFSGRYAWISNTLSTGILFIIGDIIEQKIEITKGQHQFDWERQKRIGIIGFFEGPPHHFFYKYLDKVLPGNSKSTVVKKIFADQIIASPLFNIQFFMGMSLLEGQSFRESWKEFINKFPTVFMVDCMLWPPFQFINFYLIPGRYRVFYVNVVTVFWNIFLSYMKHYDHNYEVPVITEPANRQYPLQS